MVTLLLRWIKTFTFWTVSKIIWGKLLIAEHNKLSELLSSRNQIHNLSVNLPEFIEFLKLFRDEFLRK